MNSSPKPCMYCGVNFMKKKHWDEKEKTCHSCTLKMNKKKSKEVKTMIKIAIDCTPDEHLQLETICFSQGKTFSDYFMDLHRKSYSVSQDNPAENSDNKKSTRKSKKETDE